VNTARRLTAWFEERTGLPGAVRALLNEPVPGGARWFYALGAVLGFLLVLEFFTGILLSFYYAPTATDAWASVAFIQDQLTFGWFIRGLHSFGGSAMIVVSVLHLLQVVIFGAYRAPREANWIVGLVLFALVLLFCMSGFGLPWDQKGYWARLVETGILGTAPAPGPALERLVQGGGSYGNFTVVHLFAVHALVLPLLAVALLVLHVTMVRRHKLTPSWRLTAAEASRYTERYWPGQAFRDAVLTALAVGLVVAMVAHFHGAALEGPADPTSGYQARPEWYARPLYQLRIMLDGPWELLATLVIPGTAVALLVALPLLDRATTHEPGRRWPVIAGVLAGLAATIGLGVYSLQKDFDDARYRSHRADVEVEAKRARRLALGGVLPEGGLAVYRNDPDFIVRELWQEHCSSCHSLSGRGGEGAPDLHDYNSRAWISGFLRDPQGPLFMGPAKKQGPGKGMPPFRGTDDELAAITEFVYLQTGVQEVDGALITQAEALFSEKNCDACHEVDGTSAAKGPNLLHRGTLAWVKKVIEDSGRPELYGDRAKMPRFAKKLTPEQIELLAKFVIGQRKGESRVGAPPPL
jgi:ubiquinol-cytochrome c reductase cytochrome b subunit